MTEATPSKTITVIALGGNAILQRGQKVTAEEQFKNVQTTCQELVKIVKSLKYKIVITHGNGPQVGNILLQHEAGQRDGIPAMPLDVCGAQSQGLIGYMLVQSLGNALAVAGRADIPLACLITQVLVDKNDPAFSRPTKPIGPFYTAEQAEQLRREKGYVIIDDAGRGYRRVVPSPNPISITEKVAIKQLLDARTIVIASGGGGIPVVQQDGRLQGIEAVIDKDLAAERLAEDVQAKLFLMLTDVKRVMINYRKSNEKALDHLTVAEAERYLKDGHFAEGSMKPKIEAAIRFIKSGGQRAIISSLEEAFLALEGQAGTVIAP